MISRRYKYQSSEIFIFIGFFLLTVNLLTYQAMDLASIKNIVRYLAVGCIFMGVLLGIRKIKWNIYLLIIVAYSIFLIFFIKSGAGNAVNMIAIILVMWAAETLDEKRIKRLFCYVAYAAIIVWVLLLVFGKIRIVPWDTMRYNIKLQHNIPRIRYSLGFLYEINLGAWYLTSAIVTIMYCKGINRKRLIVGSILNVIIYLITDSRTTFFFYCIFIFVYYFMKRWNGIISMKLISVGLAFIFSVPFIAAILISRFPLLDTLTSGRVHGLVKCMSGMTRANFLFGGYYFPLACFYYLLFTQFGIFVYFFFYVLFCNILSTYREKKDYLTFALLASCMLVGLMEGSIFATEEISTLLFWTMVSKGSSIKCLGITLSLSRSY